MFEECVELALMIVAMLSLGFFRLVPAIPVRPNSIRHLLVLSSLFGSSFAGNFIVLVSLGQGVFTANLTIAVGMAVSYWWWALRMNRSGEVLPFAVPPMASLEQIEALNEWDRRLYAEGKAMLDDNPPQASSRRSSETQLPTTLTGFPILNQRIAAAHRSRKQRRL
jgi:hypothetical protein